MNYDCYHQALSLLNETAVNELAIIDRKLLNYCKSTNKNILNIYCSTPLPIQLDCRPDLSKFSLLCFHCIVWISHLPRHNIDIHQFNQLIKYKRAANPWNSKQNLQEQYFL